MENEVALFHSTCYPSNVENFRNARTTFLSEDNVVKYEVGLGHMGP